MSRKSTPVSKGKNTLLNYFSSSQKKEKKKSISSQTKTTPKFFSGKSLLKSSLPSQKNTQDLFTQTQQQQQATPPASESKKTATTFGKKKPKFGSQKKKTTNKFKAASKLKFSSTPLPVSQDESKATDSEKKKEEKPKFGSQRNEKVNKLGNFSNKRFGLHSKKFGSAKKKVATPVKEEKKEPVPEKKKRQNEESDSEDDMILCIKKNKRKRKAIVESDDEYDPMVDTSMEKQDKELDNMDLDLDDDDEDDHIEPPKKKRKLTPKKRTPKKKRETVPMEVEEEEEEEFIRLTNKMDVDTEAEYSQYMRSNAEAGSYTIRRLRKPKHVAEKKIGKKKKTGQIKGKEKDPRGEKWYDDPCDHDGVPHSDPSSKKWQLRIPKPRFKNFTPGLCDYWKIKQNANDGILFYKVGKFYEIYLKDAEISHELLHLNYMNDSIPHVGFPEVNVERYTEGLVSHGYKVYRVEEMESPQEQAKRVAAAKKKGELHQKGKLRALCSVATPGTYVNDRESKERYTLSIWEEFDPEGKEPPQFNIIWLESSTAEFAFASFGDDRCRSRFRGLLAQNPPQEILIGRNMLSKETLECLRRDAFDANIRKMNMDIDGFMDRDSIIRQIKQKNYFENDGTPPMLLKFLENESMALAFGGLLNHLTQAMLDKELMCQRRFIEFEIANYANKKFVVLDNSAIENLGIFIDETGGKKGSLFNLLNNTCTSFGRRLLKIWIIRPLARQEDIALRLNAVANFVEEDTLVESITERLRELPDLEKLKSKICRMSAGSPMDQAFFNSASFFYKGKVRNLLEFLHGMRKLWQLYEFLHSRGEDIHSERIQQLISPEHELPDFKSIIEEIIESFDHKYAQEEQQIQPAAGHCAEYDELKKKLFDADAQAKRYKNECERWYKPFPKKVKGPLKWLKSTSKCNGYFVNIPKTLKTKKGIPPGWRETKTAISNKELDALSEIKTKCEAELEDLYKTYLKLVFGKIQKATEILDKVIACTAELDCLCSLAIVSSGDMCKPEFVASENPLIELKESRHPCVDASNNLTGTTTFIPNDISIGGEKQNFLAITGPNMGGKSTILRQVCVTIILAQIGCYVPCNEARLTPVDRIFTRIGANDSILTGQSTFMVELEETSNILRNATPRSLVILDELGRGTSTYDGAAIAYQTAEYITQHINCRTMFTTHYHSIIDKLGELPAVSLHYMDYKIDEERQKVIFLYKFVQGICRDSHGINCARLAGIRSDLVTKSRAYGTLYKAAANKNLVNELFSICLDFLRDVNSFERLAEKMKSLLS